MDGSASGDVERSAVRPSCPLCLAGNKPRLRASTGEWVHQSLVRTAYSIVVCLAPPVGPE